MTEATAYTYATNATSAERARAEYEAARAAGLPVAWIEDTELPFAVSGAVSLSDQFHIDPQALCHALAIALGPERVAAHTAVRDVDETGNGCTVTLENGRVITAPQVVIATQAPIVDPALLNNRCTPMQSYALAARVTKAVPTGMYLSCDDETRSLRPALIGDDVVAVVGGEGHRMGDAAAGPDRWQTLAAWAEEHFGDAEVTHRWATHDLVTTDHVPFIGRLRPGAQRCWVATGFAKWGMTNGYVAAHIISEAIGGGSVPWASTFDSTRIASSFTGDLVTAGIHAARHLVVDRVTRRAEPRCTHQGCVMRKDAALGTWDCPCHGSRFDADGAVIQGPATKALD